MAASRRAAGVHPGVSGTSPRARARVVATKSNTAPSTGSSMPVGSTRNRSSSAQSPCSSRITEWLDRTISQAESRRRRRVSSSARVLKAYAAVRSSTWRLAAMLVSVATFPGGSSSISSSPASPRIRDRVGNPTMS